MYCFFKCENCTSGSLPDVKPCLPHSSLSNSCIITCDVSNHCGSVNAGEMVLRILELPVVEIDVKKDTLCVGMDYSLMLETTDAIQWFHNDKELVGENRIDLSSDQVRIT